MSITVKEILGLPVFQDAKYVAGKEGEIRHVRWVTMLELLNETKQLEPEELLLTTAFDLSVNGDMKHNLINSLAEQGLSGIIIQTGYYLEEIPEEILREGDRCRFPIIEIPRNLSFSEITRYVHKYILNKQFEKIQFSEELYKTFTDIALKNEGIRSICNVVSNLIGGKIQIVDTSMNVLCDIISKEQPVDLPDNLIRDAIVRLKDDFDSGMVLSKTIETDTCHMLVAPIKAKDHIYGYITVAKSENINEFEEIAVHHTSTMCALEFLKLSSLEEKERKMRADYLELLLTDSFKDDMTVYSKGEALGYPIGTHDTCVAILGIDGFQEITNIDKLETQLLKSVQKLMQGYGLHHLSKLFSGQLVLLITNQYPNRVDITETLEK
ncbi:MAG: PucR family transcriptional regulator ligand-binding domain-containing protein, partial [Clostridia bacterium]